MWYISGTFSILLGSGSKMMPCCKFSEFAFATPSLNYIFFFNALNNDNDNDNDNRYLYSAPYKIGQRR